ncbi:hypothetical protein SLEP1_g10724 [Rubroshorea leprosula]|uniref:Core-2/I-branching beta-1,6-N-acetylglucosaminyltransferase family protein n=1 Tax=Rubroshorea leprosula TaxID=152421 RepID=A0AAV5I8Z2_9ROSI|nr:hypothetical protein SLEP1_g10724 [Rubroshorea leprosula]
MSIEHYFVQPMSRNFNSLLIYALSLVIGLTLGIIISFYLKNSPSSLLLSLSLNFFSPPAPPSDSPVPPPSSLILPPPPPPPPPDAAKLPSVLLLSFQTNISSNSTSVSLKEKKSLMHNMTDQELLWRASMVRGIRDFSHGKHVPKVAFLFLAVRGLPFATLWEKFLKGHEDLYSIYLHQHPDYFEEIPESSAFYGRRIPSQPVYWGTSSMIDAERRLLANALLDQSNQRFVLLSESCIPLFNFTATYNYLINSSQSFLSLYDDPRKQGRGRYNPQMSPEINITDWRKGSQWFELHRDLAMAVISDTKYYPIFRDKCRPPCYNDEHYIPTLVNMHYGELNSNRSITFVDWSRGGPHPRRFVGGDISDELLNQSRFGSECIYNGNTTNMCFLFARKFHPNALEPLLRVAPLVLGFDP